MYREEVLQKLEDLNYEILTDEEGYMKVLIEYTERPLFNHNDQALQ